jgi:uncharacterized protein YjbI with pentapeptide repeats
MNEKHLAILREGVETWNAWRKENADEPPPDLSKANLSKANLSRANLFKANLIEANLSKANLIEANLFKANLTGASLIEANLYEATLIDANLSGANTSLSGANFTGANLSNANLFKANLAGANLSRARLFNANLIEANLSKANLTMAILSVANLAGANLIEANLSAANLSGANFTGANLAGASLIEAVLVKTGLRKTNLTKCWVYGLSAWDVELDGAVQTNLRITRPDEPEITVDDLEVAQFIYLLLNNQNIRHVIDTITSKVVLILGRFTPERKPILDAIRDELRKRDYLPVLFDFDKPSNRDITETVSTLAHMAKFVIADITDARSIPQELMAIVPTLPSVPVQPLLLASQREYGMFEHFKRYPWVLEPYLYEDQDRLLAAITDKVIGPAEKKAKEQTGK